MGAVRDIVTKLGPETTDMENQKHLIETLAQLATAKADFFDLQISTSLRTAGSPDNQTVPVEAVLASTTETHAYSSKNSQLVGDAVTSSLKSFCTGTKDNILAGVGTLISAGLTAFLGDSSASEDMFKKYYIMTEGYSVVRLDVIAWKRDVEAEGIQALMEKVSAFVAVKSAVDLTQIKFNTFLNVYARQLENMNLPQDQLQKALDEAREIYNKFHSSLTQAPALSDRQPLFLTGQPG